MSSKFPPSLGPCLLVQDYMTLNLYDMYLLNIPLLLYYLEGDKILKKIR